MDQLGYATHARMLVEVPKNIPFAEGHLHYEPISAGKDLSSSLSCNVTDLVHWNKGHFHLYKDRCAAAGVIMHSRAIPASEARTRFTTFVGSVLRSTTHPGSDPGPVCGSCSTPLEPD